MIDKNLISLLGKDFFNIFNLLMNLTVSFSICYVVEIFLRESNPFISSFLVPVVLACLSLVFHFINSMLIGRMEGILVEKSKEHFRNDLFSKIMFLGS